MRSKTIKIGVVGATLAAMALVLTALTAGAGASGAVGSGTASATKSVCGLGNGKKATGAPIKLQRGWTSSARPGARRAGRNPAA